MNQHKNDINELCKTNKVKSLFIFGSAITNDFSDQSDIDLVVDINESDPFKYTDYYYQIKIGLQNILKRPIDLLEERAIKNKYFRKELERTKVLIYG